MLGDDDRRGEHRALGAHARPEEERAGAAPRGLLGERRARLERLEEILLAADFGVSATLRLVDAVETEEGLLTRFEVVPGEDGDRLLAELYWYMLQPNAEYRHKWRAGDIGSSGGILRPKLLPTSR